MPTDYVGAESSCLLDLNSQLVSLWSDLSIYLLLHLKSMQNKRPCQFNLQNQYKGIDYMCALMCMGVRVRACMHACICCHIHVPLDEHLINTSGGPIIFLNDVKQLYFLFCMCWFSSKGREAYGLT